MRPSRWKAYFPSALNHAGMWRELLREWNHGVKRYFMSGTKTGGSNIPVTSTTIPHVLDDFTDVSNKNENTAATTNIIEDSSTPTTPRDNETSPETEAEYSVYEDEIVLTEFNIGLM
ncbi:unnamed protein product [Euphydryas editha]|uniref:Uncharacterized protein n=1 Tax=Euphydryas editha TaxID=104508 RepID=A0AAU9U8W7_EUPED|nr:unnamed protein product [Euphydryas editha]